MGIGIAIVISTIIVCCTIVTIKNKDKDKK